MKNRKILTVIWIVNFVLIIIGSTFSFFTSRIRSDEKTVSATSMLVRANLKVKAIYNDKMLIPMNDSDVITGYNNQCVDIRGFGACQAYSIVLENIDTKISYSGTINFTLDDIEHLKYLVIEENGEVYSDKEVVVAGTNQTLGDEFLLEAGESKKLILLIWLPNYDYNQNEEDAGGSFTADISFESTYGSRLTGSIYGQG